MAHEAGNKSMRPANWLDRAIGFVSPEAGLRRMQSRLRMVAMARGFEAVKMTRRREGPRAPGTSVNSELRGALAVLRNASREAIRNSGYARKAIRSLVTKSIGTGIVPRPKTGNPKLDKEIEAAFEIWSAECDPRRRADYFGLQKLAVRSMFEAGEGLGRRRPRRANSGLHVPMQIQLMEPDHIDSQKEGALSDGRIVQGIEIDDEGRPRRHWLFPDHPGEYLAGRYGWKQSNPVPSSDMIHLFDEERVGAVRGVPWLCAVIVALEDLGDYKFSERLRKKLEACMVGVVIGDDADHGIALNGSGETAGAIGPRVTDSRGNVIESFEPGMLLSGKGAKDIKFHTPTANVDYPGYNRTELTGIAAGAQITYELLTADMSNVNYSTYRAGLNDLHEMISQLQWLTIIPQFCIPTWRWFIDAAFLAGRISQRHYGVEWEPPKFSSPDPLKDFLTDLGEIRAGLQSQPMAIARRGYHWRGVLQEQQDWLKAVDEANLVFDSDPRKVTKTGVASGVSEPNSADSIGRAALDILEREGDPAAPVLRALLDGRLSS